MVPRNTNSKIGITGDHMKRFKTVQSNTRALGGSGYYFGPFFVSVSAARAKAARRAPPLSPGGLERGLGGLGVVAGELAVLVVLRQLYVHHAAQRAVSGVALRVKHKVLAHQAVDARQQFRVAHVAA